jgi:hypothetical protein
LYLEHLGQQINHLNLVFLEVLAQQDLEFLVILENLEHLDRQIILKFLEVLVQEDLEHLEVPEYLDQQIIHLIPEHLDRHDLVILEDLENLVLLLEYYKDQRHPHNILLP